MSKECVEKFLDKLEQDPAFKAQLQKAKSQDEVKAIFKQHQLSFTKEEYIEVFQKRKGVELGPQELAKVAAGATGRPGDPLAFFS